MSEPNSPVQPLDSAGSDHRLATMLGGAKQSAGQPAAAPGVEVKVDPRLCPNCKNGQDKEVDLDDSGKCPECGFDNGERLY